MLFGQRHARDVCQRPVVCAVHSYMPILHPYLQIGGACLIYSVGQVIRAHYLPCPLCILQVCCHGGLLLIDVCGREVSLSFCVLIGDGHLSVPQVCDGEGIGSHQLGGVSWHLEVSRPVGIGAYVSVCGSVAQVLGLLLLVGTDEYPFLIAGIIVQRGEGEGIGVVCATDVLQTKHI